MLLLSGHYQWPLSPLVCQVSHVVLLCSLAVFADIQDMLSSSFWYSLHLYLCSASIVSHLLKEMFCHPCDCFVVALVIQGFWHNDYFIFGLTLTIMSNPGMSSIGECYVFLLSVLKTFHFRCSLITPASIHCLTLHSGFLLLPRMLEYRLCLSC